MSLWGANRVENDKYAEKYVLKKKERDKTEHDNLKVRLKHRCLLPMARAQSYELQ